MENLGWFKVVWFCNERGYGFVKNEDGKVVVVHYSRIKVRQKWKELKVGQKVRVQVHPETPDFAEAVMLK